MGTGEQAYRTQIVVAIIGVSGVLGAALIANWSKLFPPGPSEVNAQPMRS